MAGQDEIHDSRSDDSVAIRNHRQSFVRLWGLLLVLMYAGIALAADFRDAVRNNRLIVFASDLALLALIALIVSLVTVRITRAHMRR